MKLFAISILISFTLQSCVIHSSVPFICFAKGCVQNKKKEKNLAMRVKLARLKKPKSTKGKNVFVKNKTKQKNTIQAKNNDSTREWTK